VAFGGDRSPSIAMSGDDFIEAMLARKAAGKR
jgi:hypothetical protein